MNEINNKQETAVQNEQQTSLATSDPALITNEILDKILIVQKEQNKQLKALKSYLAVVSLAAGIQIIIWLLSFMGVMRLFSLQ